MERVTDSAAKLRKAANSDHRHGAAISQPCDLPKSGKIAIKVNNHFGDEVLKVYPIGR